MMQDLTFETATGGRLDQCLAAVSGLSRRRIRRAIDEGGVYVNRKRCRTAGRSLRGGEQLRMCMLDDETLIPFCGEQLLWQNDGLFLIHKYAGQYAQAALHRSKGTLPDELHRHLQLPPTAVVAPVHRLDRGTSGLMLLASNQAHLQALQARWRTDVKKSYLGIITTVPSWGDLRIRSKISPRRDSAGRYAIDHEKGRDCDSEIICLKQHHDQTLLKLIPHTGRSHQLRVHLASIGCPLLGDRRYGGQASHRLMLHAQSLQFPLPNTNHMQHWQVEPKGDWSWS